MPHSVQNIVKVQYCRFLLLTVFAHSEIYFQKRDDARAFMKFLHPDLGLGNKIMLLDHEHLPYGVFFSTACSNYFFCSDT